MVFCWWLFFFLLETYMLKGLHDFLIFIFACDTLTVSLNLFRGRKKVQTYHCLVDVPIIKLHLLYLYIKMLMSWFYFNVNLTWWYAIIMKPWNILWLCLNLYPVSNCMPCFVLVSTLWCKRQQHAKQILLLKVAIEAQVSWNSVFCILYCLELTIQRMWIFFQRIVLRENNEEKVSLMKLPFFECGKLMVLPKEVLWIEI